MGSALVLVMLTAILGLAYLATGAGGFARQLTISGIYPIVRPNGYDVICFADADSSDGGIACMPCSLVNDCVKK